MVNVVPREVLRSKPLGPATRGFWPWDLPRHSIHHDTSSAFSNNVPVYSVQCIVCTIHYALSSVADMITVPSDNQQLSTIRLIDRKLAVHQSC